MGERLNSANIQTMTDEERNRQLPEKLRQDKALLDKLKLLVAGIGQPDTRMLVVNKRTHQIRFENETEDEVTIIIEGKK